MFGSKRNLPALFTLLAVLASLAMVFSACTSTTFHLITPVATLDAAQPEAAATTDAAQPETPVDEATPEAVAEATAEPAAEVAAEATEAPAEEAVAEATEEAAEEPAAEAGEDLTAEIAAGATPSAIPHKLERREACLECHAVDGREPAPANHAKYETDDICLFCHMPEEGEASVPAQPDPVTKEFCLTCHGPFEDLSALTADYVGPDGMAANPHVYVPHDKTTILECKLCHEPHQLPVQSIDDIPQASVQYCYAACHHEYNFEPCSKCH